MAQGEISKAHRDVTDAIAAGTLLGTGWVVPGKSGKKGPTLRDGYVSTVTMRPLSDRCTHGHCKCPPCGDCGARFKVRGQTPECGDNCTAWRCGWFAIGQELPRSLPVPDAWRVVESNECGTSSWTLEVAEVNVTHHQTLSRYVNLWWDLDCESSFLRGYIVERHGVIVSTWGELEFTDEWYRQLGERVEPDPFYEVST